MNVILYSRVSTSIQDTAPQLRELAEVAAIRKWTVLASFEDVISGSKAKRPALDQVRARVASGGVDAVVTVKIDRLGRSLANFVELVAQFRKHGTGIICTSQGIDTTAQSPCGNLMAGLLGCIAEFERELIRERTRAGLAVARAAGKKIGRPSAKLPPEPERTDIVWRWRVAGGRGYRKLGEMLGGVSGATAMRVDRKVPRDPKVEAAYNERYVAAVISAPTDDWD